MLFDGHCPNARVPFWFLLVWLLWSDRTLQPMKWDGRAFRSILLRCHGNIAPCQGNVWVFSLLWVVELQVLPAHYYSEVWYHLLWVYTPGILFLVHRMLIFQCWLLSPHRKVAWVPHLVFLDGLQGYSWRCRGGHLSLSKLINTLEIPLALTFFLGICQENLHCTLVTACRNTFPKERWWYRFWMHLDPIQWCNL